MHHTVSIGAGINNQSIVQGSVICAYQGQSDQAHFTWKTIIALD